MTPTEMAHKFHLKGRLCVIYVSPYVIEEFLKIINDLAYTYGLPLDEYAIITNLYIPKQLGYVVDDEGVGYILNFAGI